ncbi:VOC family protein [Halosolutus gelatinilyticus]|uniref:VOC family protein n=1 Tax=Halosolutus gelatinilyticus TaxID=2931975 RepID=UPI001FF3171D|nr:VOC family protein [Halosolutus gelatinilyticus]
MSEPELARLGHVALETPDLDESMAFFHDAVGLEVVDREETTAYLRAADEFDHHSLILSESESAGVSHIGWQTREPEHVSAFADRLTEQGIDVTWIGAGDELGQGEAIRFRTRNGHEFEIYYEMEKPDPPEERRSRLRNRVYSPTETNPIAPRDIDHVQIWDPDVVRISEWLQETLGFEVHEYYDLEDGSRWGTWLSAGGCKIDVAIIRDDDADVASFNHVAYTVDNANALFDAYDAMKERELPVDGLGQHSVSRGKFCYTRDPVTDHRIEFSDGGYVVFDPNWEPIAWNETDLEERQWIGGFDGLESVRY